MADLPLIDRHEIEVAAPPAVVWEAISLGVFRRGFRVTRSSPPSRLVFAGRHPFSVYELDVRVEPAEGGSRLSAETRAAFPGPHGHLYRLLVVGSGGHRLVVRRMLRRIARRAERATPSR